MPENATYTAPVPGLAAVLGALVADGSAVPAATAGTAAGAAALVVDPHADRPSATAPPQPAAPHCARIGADEFPGRVMLELAAHRLPQAGTSLSVPRELKVPRVNEETGQVTTSFELTDRQRDLRVKARAFARDVLREAKATAERLPSAEERFSRYQPAYQRLVAEGFLRACIPTAEGGDNESLLDTAVVMEELYCENPSVP